MNRNSRFVFASTLVGLGAFLLSACASPVDPTPEPAPEVTIPVDSDSDDGATSQIAPAPEGMQNSTFTMVDAYTIADASCTKAQTEGVVESNSDINLVSVMVPKEEGIDGYSAAYLMDDEYSLIFSMDYFDVCLLAVEYGMMEEAGSDPDNIYTLVDSTDDSFTVLVNYDGDYMFHYRAEFNESGIIAAVQILNSDLMPTLGTTSVSYGPTEEDKDIIQKAHDAFMSEE